MLQEVMLFKNTKTAEKILLLDKVYHEIEAAELEWQKACAIRCVNGCGMCCVHFEPAIYEVEALYLAAWLLYHQRKRALEIALGNFNENVLDKQNGCLLFDIDNPNHCSVYGGRSLICRLFGYAGERDKDFTVRWRSCKYQISIDKNLKIKRSQYSQEELINFFGTIPPVMSDFSSRILCFMTEKSYMPKPIRYALPEAIRKIIMLEKYSDGGGFEPNTDPETPPMAS